MGLESDFVGFPEQKYYHLMTSAKVRDKFWGTFSSYIILIVEIICHMRQKPIILPENFLE